MKGVGAKFAWVGKTRLGADTQPDTNFLTVSFSFEMGVLTGKGFLVFNGS